MEYTHEPIRDMSMIEDALMYMDEPAAELIKCNGTLQICRDLLRSLHPGSSPTLHFNIVKTLWEDLTLIRPFLKVRHVPSMRLYMLSGNIKLSRFLLKKIRSDPSFEDIMKYQDKAAMMRDALSILIGYWSNGHMITLFCSMGGFSLLTSVKGDHILDRGKETSESSTHSTIEELHQDSSIKDLAYQLLKNPKVVELLEKFMVTLVQTGNKAPEDHYQRLYVAASDCWFDRGFIIELMKALKQSAPLVTIFKKYSKEAQLLRSVERMTHIQKDPLLNSILKSDCPLQQMRGALSILFGYWSYRDLNDLVRLFFIARRTRVRLAEEDTVQVFEYIADCPDDAKGLENMLADKYSKDSEEYKDLFDKIRKSQKIAEQAKKIRKQAKKIRKPHLDGPAQPLLKF